MPFPTGGADAPAAGAPTSQQQQPAAAPPASTAQPAPAPVSQAAPAGPNLWIDLNGNVSPMEAAQYQSLPPTTPAMSEDQTSGWKTIADFVSAPAAQQPAPQQQSWGTNNQPDQQQQQQQNTGGGYNPYDGVESAEINSGSFNYLRPGDYIVQVTGSYFKEGRNNKGQVLELHVITSPDPTLHPGSNVEGSDASIFFNKNDSFAGHMKELVITGSGFDDQGNPRPREDKVTREETAEMLNGQSPAIIGALLYVEARNVVTKAGNDFTATNFWPVKASGQLDGNGRPVPDFNSVPKR